ncbi:SDR family NAD(P)-dependent oxidoreductase [Perlucidibaca piscinae]|uniref:SDR family NAD(P)-dependent oxidoreductase n=1 Tax=Perlucidibaca piscinae TaxID=392589 RepID=UPI0003B3BAC8|nr:SDR family NAD(P)-dependent oxidoreductase [Perlucidibaca piscinae]
MANRKTSSQASAVVTGAGSGIGRAFAVELAARGGRVVCADINLATAQDTVDLIDAAGGKALAVRCDVSLLADVEALAVVAEDWLQGQVDLVINNAGVGAGGQLIGETPIADWQWTLSINLWGIVHGCHVFAPKLRALGHGGIINVCSTASFAAAPKMGPYNVSKAAALALSETLAAEMAGTGVAVTALCPTWVKTNIASSGRISASSSRLAEKLMARFGVAPERVAKTTLDALDRSRLYVLPQLDARMVWRSKRLAPALYASGAGLINRLAGDRI